jgi:hypothetical protein
VSKEGRTEELTVDRTVQRAEGVNGGVKANRESLAECAFKEVAEADRRGKGDGVELVESSRTDTLG